MGPLAQAGVSYPVPAKNAANRFHEVIRGLRFMSKCVRLDQFRLPTLTQLKDWGFARVARLSPDPSLLRGRQRIADEDKVDFFLLTQFPDTRAALGRYHYKTFFFKNGFPHIRKNGVPGCNQNSVLFPSQMSFSQARVCTLWHIEHRAIKCGISRDRS
jgi:hypothetical protein